MRFALPLSLALVALTAAAPDASAQSAGQCAASAWSGVVGPGHPECVTYPSGGTICYLGAGEVIAGDVVLSAGVTLQVTGGGTVPVCSPSKWDSPAGNLAGKAEIIIEGTATKLSPDPMVFEATAAPGAGAWGGWVFAPGSSAAGFDAVTLRDATTGVTWAAGGANQAKLSKLRFEATTVGLAKVDGSSVLLEAPYFAADVGTGLVVEGGSLTVDGGTNRAQRAAQTGVASVTFNAASFQAAAGTSQDGIVASGTALQVTGWC